MLIRTEPTVLDEVISVTSAICPRWLSRGLATVVATSSGLPPGNVARTEIVGKSTCGSGETGNLKKATAPAAARPKVSNVVPMGRRINGVEGPIGVPHSAGWADSPERPEKRIAKRSNQR